MTSPPWPITELRLHDFKSVKDEVVPLTGLTLLLGANSSGKSNVIRALLALAQAVDAGSMVGSFPMNGARINLGEFKDVARQQGATDAPSPVVRIGISATLEQSQLYGYPPDFDILQSLGDRPLRVTYDVGFSGYVTDDPIMSPLHDMNLQLTAGDLDSTLRLSLTRTTADHTSLDGRSVVAYSFYYPRANTFHGEFRGSLRSKNASYNVSAVALAGTVPYLAVSPRLQPRVLAETWANTVSAFLFDVQGAHGKLRPTSEQLVDLAVQTIADWLRKPTVRRDNDFDRFAMERVAESPYAPERVARSVGAHQDELVKQIVARLPAGRKVPAVVGGPEGATLRIAAQGLQGLVRRIWYLGGLREAPLPLYPPSPNVQTGDIGQTGQFTAAVLHALRDRVVQRPTFGSSEVERSPLQAAVEYWADKLGLFSEVQPHHRGGLGLDIMVRQPGLAEPLDITSVGLGVSQLLPIIVRCLLAKPGEVVVLEQPEIHLHPASQQRLADFLLACARSGRQLLVETHSEHLVNRLRLRAAEDKSQNDEIVQTVGLVFADRHPKTGITHYRSGSLNAFGGLQDWPSGFFEEGIVEAQQILKIGLDKLEEFSSGASEQ